jgi:hypothetical protein
MADWRLGQVGGRMVWTLADVVETADRVASRVSWLPLPRAFFGEMFSR